MNQPALPVKKNKVARLLLIFNGLVLLLLLYFLHAGFYHWVDHWVWLNPSERSFEIRRDFSIILGFSILLPFLIILKRGNPIWIIQPVVIIIICFFWKEDFLQRTIFINQPCSYARLAPLVDNFIAENQGKIDKDISAINHFLGRGTRLPDGILNGTDSFLRGSDSLLDILFQNNIVDNKNSFYRIVSIQVTLGTVSDLRIGPSIRNDHFQELTWVYYCPKGIVHSKSNTSSTIKIYPWKTHFFGICTNKGFHIQGKWIVRIEGSCFG